MTANNHSKQPDTCSPKKEAISRFIPKAKAIKHPSSPIPELFPHHPSIIPIRDTTSHPTQHHPVIIPQNLSSCSCSWSRGIENIFNQPWSLGILSTALHSRLFFPPEILGFSSCEIPTIGVGYLCRWLIDPNSDEHLETSVLLRRLLGLVCWLAGEVGFGGLVV
jgi:hypothetical protein